MNTQSKSVSRRFAVVKKTSCVLLIISLAVLFPVMLFAQDKKTGGIPPAKVVVEAVRTGMLAPHAEFVGTVYYAEVSDVSSEVSGKVEKVLYEEGQKMKKGQVLIKLSTDLLKKNLTSTRASYEQVLADLENARLQFKRVEALYKQESIAEQTYDESRFKVKGLEKKAESLYAEVGRLEIELKKKKVRAPFNGIVIKKAIDIGEWISPGTSVAKIGRDDKIDILVDVPQKIIPYIKPGIYVECLVGENKMRGKVLAIIPEGDIATRTFPVKVRVRNTKTLFAGMEALVQLPSGEKSEVLVVPRDAVITVFGNTVVFAVIENKAKMIPVNVIGYEGIRAGIHAQGLEEGMMVVIKGNERLRPDQPVIYQ